MANEPITVELTRDHALVLVGWLARTTESRQPAEFVDQAEERVLLDLESNVAYQLTEPLRADYHELIRAARARVRD
ncbi:hypothetical protein [Skermania piniformis]|uniref:Uncharacterized protein n=1 Tax=Skermania pinensis TaxID=39122 RepID=A0ABX8S9Y7_9ACTN|nr:hypothetical protein [Skermania piniformis]QXQ14121.1 hypothetical protein KV203_01320 [Skermania piniformis]